MSSERSAELALRLWQAFRSRDWDQVTALVHPDAEIETTPCSWADGRRE